MFGMLWINMYDSVFQFANIQQFHTDVEEEWYSIPQAIINSLINSVKEMSHCMRQMLVTPDTDWFSDPRPYFKKKGTCDQQMHICIPSHVKAIDEGQMNLFELTVESQ
jgi:hypothetical protein